MDLAQQIRSALLASGKSQREVARDSGVPQPRVNAFARGGGLRLEHASALCAALGLELRGKLLTSSRKVK